MHIAVIGTGKIGRSLGESLAAAGHDIRYGSRTPEHSVRASLDGAEAVIVAIPGGAVAAFARDHAGELVGKVVIDASNKFDPVFDGVVADLFYSADAPDRGTLEGIIADVGLNPVHLGPGQHDLLDQLLNLWFTLVNGQGRRHLALKVL